MSSIPNEIRNDRDKIVHVVMSEAVKIMNADELAQLRAILENTSFDELVEFLESWFADIYDHRPVPVRQWVEDAQYMGLKGQIFPKLLDDFEELFEGGYEEAVLEGSVGWGKSFFGGLALTRMVYEVSCLKNPQLVYGLAEGSPIVFLNVATTFATAKEVVFEYVKGFVERSHYFRTKFPMDKNLVDELRFPKMIRVAPVSSTQSGILGQNMFGGIIDEANFMFKGRSTRARGLNEEYDHAKVLWNAMIRRMKSRFMQHGKLPGILIIISSSLYPHDFTSWRVKKAIEENDSKVFYRRYSQWEPRPKNYYSGVTFTLSLGNQTHKARVLRKPGEEGYDPILDDAEALKRAGVELMEVPEEYKSDFLRDIDMAIRDLAGRPTLAVHPFFRDSAPIREAIERGTTRGLKHPFISTTVTLNEGKGWIRDNLDFSKRNLHHFAHIDLAITQDAAGIALVRIDDLTTRTFLTTGANGELEEVEEVVPRMSSVLLLQVVAPPGGEIDVSKVRKLILQLIEWGFQISRVTYDQYQSAESIQQLQRRGVEAGRLSVDRSLDPYNTLKEAIYEGRLDLYNHPVLVDELLRLERDLRRNKIDHPPHGSKDVADALAGAVFNATVFARTFPSTIVQGEVVAVTDVLGTLSYSDDEALEIWRWLVS